MPELGARLRKRIDLRHSSEKRVDGSSQVTNPFTMNYTNAENAAFLTFAQVMRDEIFYFFRIESMQIENAINRVLNRIVRFWSGIIHRIAGITAFVDFTPTLP